VINDPLDASRSPAGWEARQIRLIDDALDGGPLLGDTVHGSPDADADADADADPRTVILTCANCGAAMDERKCKLICRCGYFLSCSDYY